MARDLAQQVRHLLALKAAAPILVFGTALNAFFLPLTIHDATEALQSAGFTLFFAAVFGIAYAVRYR